MTNVSFSLKSGSISIDPKLCKYDVEYKSISCTEGNALIRPSDLDVSPDIFHNNQTDDVSKSLVILAPVYAFLPLHFH